jgi:hypothetical protein
MADLRQALHALVEHPPAPPSPIEDVFARGTRFARRRRAKRGAVSLLLVAGVAAGGVGIAQQASEPESVVAADRAGVPVSYTDEAGDAVGTTPEVAAYDIVRVAWEPADGAGGGGPRDYSISITIAGVAEAEGAYIARAELRSAINDETCQISHILTPGRSAVADVVCGSINQGTQRVVGRVEGGLVTSTPSGGGTRLRATFDASTLPPEAAGQAFNDLATITACPEGRPGCRLIYLDEARSDLSYRP